ncbi:hypothetical protein QWJ46_00780 [Rhizobium sp. CBN3]|uniref:hypothetical protein n=1 Tax=Rhizobium sp. CBN3 TaxID=3058045 RepID=UPI0026732EBC|nr:hypothetical protein [Rhizobium sp. CBN3]MDO3431209.1 hypothetical protein [Rhizobium sp. CBN3]
MRRFLEIKGWSPGYLYVAPQHVTIMAACQACGTEREFDRQSVPRRLEFALIPEIEAHLKCSACGSKAGRLLFGSYLDG